MHLMPRRPGVQRRAARRPVLKLADLVGIEPAASTASLAACARSSGEPRSRSLMSMVSSWSTRSRAGEQAALGLELEFRAQGPVCAREPARRFSLLVKLALSQMPTMIGGVPNSRDLLARKTPLINSSAFSGDAPICCHFAP